MQSIQQGIENKIIINSKGLYSYLLIQFYSNITCQSFNAIFQDLTPTLPFTTVNINEVGPDGVVDWLDGEVQLNPTGGWTLTIYNQSSSVNTDPYNADYLTEIQAIVLPVEDCEQVYSPSNSCADGVVIINDQNGDLIETVTVPSGQTEITVVDTGDCQTLTELWESSTTNEKIVLYDGLDNTERLDLFNGISLAKQNQIVLKTYPYHSLNSGQQTERSIGDDKWVWENVFKPEIALWPTDRPIVLPLIDPNNQLLLVTLNFFGNLLRFTDRLGAQLYPDGVAIDHSTGIEYKIAVQIAATQQAALDNTNALTFAGKSDWMVTTEMIELSRSLYQPVTYGNFSSLNYAPFNYNSSANHHTSTDGGVLTTRNKQMINLVTNGGKKYTSTGLRTASLLYFICRKAFTYNSSTGLMELS